MVRKLIPAGILLLLILPSAGCYCYRPGCYRPYPGMVGERVVIEEPVTVREEIITTSPDVAAAGMPAVDGEQQRVVKRVITTRRVVVPSRRVYAAPGYWYGPGPYSWGWGHPFGW